MTCMFSFKRVFIEITNICNLSCMFCPRTMRAPARMDRPLFEKIIRETAPYTKEVVFHVLGEPLLHQDLIYFIDHACAQGLSVMITTNGTLLTGDLAATLAEKNIRQMNISLHCLSSVPDKEKYLKDIFNFTRLAQKHRPEGYINLRLWNMLSDDNTWTMEQLNALFHTNIVLPKELSGFKDKKSCRLSGRTYLHLDSRFAWPDMRLPVLQKKGFCYGLRTHIGILVDGTVVPCCLDSEGAVPLGNIRETPLLRVLMSDRAKKMAQGFAQGTLTEKLCEHCGYMQRFARKHKSGRGLEEELP